MPQLRNGIRDFGSESLVRDLGIRHESGILLVLVRDRTAAKLRKCGTVQDFGKGKVAAKTSVGSVPECLGMRVRAATHRTVCMLCRALAAMTSR